MNPMVFVTLAWEKELEIRRSGRRPGRLGWTDRAAPRVAGPNPIP